MHASKHKFKKIGKQPAGQAWSEEIEQLAQAIENAGATVKRPIPKASVNASSQQEAEVEAPPKQHAEPRKPRSPKVASSSACFCHRISDIETPKGAPNLNSPV